MNQQSIQTTQVFLFKAHTKKFVESGFEPQGYVLFDHAGCLELAVFQSGDLPDNLVHGLDVALPLSIDARPVSLVRFFQSPMFDTGEISRLLDLKFHDIRWNGLYNVGVFSTTTQNSLEGLRDLLSDVPAAGSAAPAQIF